MTWTIFDTAIGECGLAWNDLGFTWVQLPESDPKTTHARLVSKLPATCPMATADNLPRWVDEAIASLREHLSGRPQDLTQVPLDLSRVTPFAATVFRALQRVPAGKTVTYGELADVVGSPGAARAIGHAMATNPWPVIVPCHRVVAAAGGPGGFSAHGGLAMKQKLLRLEGGTLSAQASLFD